MGSIRIPLGPSRSLCQLGDFLSLPVDGGVQKS